MRRIIPHLAVCLAVIASAAAVRAQENNIDCESANTTVEMNFCADKDFAAADKSLNTAYRSAIAEVKGRNLDPPYSAKQFEDALRASQRAWIAFRDADCKDLVPQEWSGGTGTTSAVLSCMTEKTKQRIKDIERLLEK